MNVNEVRRETPSFDSTAGMEGLGPMECRVVYIHPLRRFYVVEFRSTVTGETWRECFYFRDRAAPKYSDTSAPRLPGRP